MLKFVEAIDICLRQKLFVVKGRAQRSEYWWFFLAQQLIIYIMSVILNIIIIFFSLIDINNDDAELVVIIMAICIFILFLAMIVPAITSAIRRLHDINFRGWWLLLSLIPFFGGIALLIMLALPGTKGDNIFGTDPLANKNDNFTDQNLIKDKEMTDYTRFSQ